MFKKILIAGIAVVVALVVVRSTWLGSHLRHSAANMKVWAAKQVPVEQEIARLRMEIKNLEGDDDKFIDKVAQMKVGVARLEKELVGLKTNLGEAELRISKLRDELGTKAEFVSTTGVKYTKDDLRSQARAFKAAEENFKSKEASLQAKRQHLELECGKLGQLQTIRRDMETELQKLETALAQERQAQAASKSTIDVTGYDRLRKEMDSVRERIDVLKTKRELRGELKLPTKNDAVEKQNAEADKYLESRFGGNKVKDVVDGSEKE